MEALRFGQAYNSKHHVVSPWLRFWVLEYVVGLPLNINSYHICQCCHVVSLVATEATFLWSLLFMSVSCSLCCMGFSSLFCLKSRCAWLVLKLSLHQLFTCKHSLTLCLLFVPCVCSECALLWISCWSLVFVSALQVVLSLSQAHFPWLVKPRAQFSYRFSLSYLATIWCSILTYPLSLILNPSLMFKPHKPSFSHTQPPFTLLTTIDLWTGDHGQLSAWIRNWH
jgi:hypothetical protein